MEKTRGECLNYYNKFLIKTIFIIVFIIASTATVSAQLSGSVGYSLLYDDNPFREITGSEEFVNSVSTGLNFQPALDNEFYLMYEGNVNAFKNVGDRFYQYHSFGLNYSAALGNAEEENIFMGADYDIKKGTSDYSIYDYNMYSAYINGKIDLAENIFGKIGYRLSSRNYPSLYDLTHFENLFYGQISTFFETRTGMFLDVAFGNKNYSMVEETNDSTGMMGKGKGKGAMAKANSYEKNVNAAQLRTAFKISQSVFENTGISLFYLNRFNLSSSGKNLQSADFIYSSDTELWDDPYSFSSNEYGITLTQKLPLEITFKLSAGYSRRHYTVNLADSLNLTQRIDGKAEYWLGISKTFESVPLFESLELTFDYMFIQNNSNMSLFTYKNSIAHFGLSLEF